MKEEAQKLIEAIHKEAKFEINIMEFCGTHTHEIFRYGIREVMPKNVRLLSGPGCPVCVTAEEDIDSIIEMTMKYNLGVITFGDMVNVPGSAGSLSYLRAIGYKVEVVYSPLEAINIAHNDPYREYILIGVGFETTAPTLAYTLKKTKELGIKNLYYYPLNKLTPPAMKAILEMGEIKIDGIIGPGHVSTVIGRKGWKEIGEKYKIPFVISGFDPLDILKGIYILVKMISRGERGVINGYPRCVTEEGNLYAQKLMYEVFHVSETTWRGLGKINESGLELNGDYKEFDARENFPVAVQSKGSKGCRCGEILRGIIEPPQCALFGKECSPQNPKGPCMVSSEGTCSAYYMYAEYGLEEEK